MKTKKDFSKANRAFKTKNVKLMIEAHKNKEVHNTSEGKYLKSSVYGGLDGIVTTFAVVSGVIGAGLSYTIILILGFANLLADGLSMAIGDYLSTKSEIEYYNREKGRERWEVEKYPQGEKQEMKEIYIKKGFNEKDSNSLVKLLSKNKKYWVNLMMHYELLLFIENKNPLKNAGVTLASFIFFGFIPLLLFVLGTVFNFKIQNSFFWTSILSGIALFTLGSVKSKLSKRNWIISGAEMLLIGGIAATVAYFIGEFLAKILG